MKSALLLALPIALLAQAPSFDVATIKPTPPNEAGAGAGRWIRMTSAHQLTAKNHALRTLLAFAYNLTPNAISGGPSWVDSDHYDIVGEVPGDKPGAPGLDEQMSMLRSLLNDRFHLTTHRESKEFPVYALTVAKGGAKLKETTLVPDAKGIPALIFVVHPDSIRLPARAAGMADLASVMQRGVFDRPVIDQTGLTGRYDFDLEFSSDESLFSGSVGNRDSAGKPGLFDALQQQLGLRLEATRGPVQTLVLDHVERPSEN